MSSVEARSETTLLRQDSDLEGLEPPQQLMPPSRFQRLLGTRRALICGVMATLALAAVAVERRAGHTAAKAGLLGVTGLVESTECQDAVVGDPCWEAARWAKTQGIHAHPEWYPGLTPQSSLFKFQATVHQAANGQCPYAPCSEGNEDGEVAPQASPPIDVAQLQPRPSAASAVKATKQVEAQYQVTDVQCTSPLVPVSGKGPTGELTMTCGCPPPQVLDRSSGVPLCLEPTGPSQMTFYVYRAQGEDDYPPENVNAADLAGLMWYLHNEVVASVPRKFGITRILRYKITMQNTQELYDAAGKQFGPFFAFDSAKCTAPQCESTWERYGFVVGCQNLDRSIANYVRDYKGIGVQQAETEIMFRKLRGISGMPSMPTDPTMDGLHSGIWYSLPGACPSETFGAKSDECMKTMSGGHCEVVDGTRQCTYNAEYAGEIRMDDLSGILDEGRGIHTYEDWWKTSYEQCLNAVARGERAGPCVHNAEYNVQTDEGVGTSFWNGKHDMEQGLRRMDRVRQLFREKYPQLPDSFEEPACL